jgi:cytochrome P450
MLPRFRRDPLSLLREWSRTWGEIVRLGAGPRLFHLVTRPEHVGHVLQHNHKAYGKKTIGYRTLSKVLGDGLVTSEGKAWRERRRLAQPAFHRDRIAKFAETMTRETEATLSTWRRDQPIDVSAEMMALTFRIVRETLMHTNVGGVEESRIGSQVTLVMKHIADHMMGILELPDWIPTPANLRFRATVREFDSLVYQAIAARRHDDTIGDDLMSMLMHAQDPETGMNLTDLQLRDEVVTIMGAGHETTASALTWTWHLLSLHAEVEEKLHAEVDTVLGGRVPVLSDLPELEYTTCVIKESMRLFPPVWALARQALEEDEIGGFQIPRGSMVLLSPYVTHRHPGYWEFPERFDPDRFRGERSHESRLAYFPFGGGPRICIGNNFAMMEAVLILALVAQRFRLERAEHAPRPLPTVTLRPSEPLIMRARARASRPHTPVDVTERERASIARCPLHETATATRPLHRSS